MNIILFGPPGAGKGTQGELAAERLDLVRLSTGDLLREARTEGTDLGQKAQRYMDAGELVPDSVILGIVREVMEAQSHRAGFIFDGFPRTETQAAGLADMMDEVGTSLDAVVVLDVADETLVRRLAGRLSCAKCGVVYNRHFEPPREEGKCDVCGSALVQRADDREETVRRRLEVYREQTAPVLDWYEGAGVAIHHIAGDRPIDAVQADLTALLSA
ncbi:MAG TPA: adenylate kinase [Longimicrobiales bacterium]|nr:adenylate kinase [Longimicrobiales bacterium]